MKWYGKKGSSGQGLIIDEETGRTVAVCYDAKDTDLLSATPDMYEALSRYFSEMEIDDINQRDMKGFEKMAYAAIAKAKER